MTKSTVKPYSIWRATCSYTHNYVPFWLDMIHQDEDYEHVWICANLASLMSDLIVDSLWSVLEASRFQTVPTLAVLSVDW